MSGIFTSPDWDEDLPDNKTNYDFKNKVSLVKTKKNKKNKTKSDKSITEVEEDEPEIVVKTPSKKEKKLKRKAEKDSKPKIIKEVEFKAKNRDKKNNFSDSLRESLKGSRFRFLNEQLYSSEGSDAVKLFQDDPEAFNAYHEGFRHQVEQWPMNPLNRIIKSIKKMPKNHIIADFGCGDAQLAKSIPNKVYSLDLVSVQDDVIACDMAKTPLENESVNVAVYCLSLMGTNLKDFFLEANRVLKVGGNLKIAEVKSRFENVNGFITGIEKCGFSLQNKDLTNNLFYFMNFKKIRNISLIETISDFSLNPCLYKKR